MVGALAGRSLLSIVPDYVLDGVVALRARRTPSARVALARTAPTRPRPALVQRSRFSSACWACSRSLIPTGCLTRAQPRRLSVMQSFVPLFVESAPPLLAGIALAVALELARPSGLFARARRAWSPLLPEGTFLSVRLLGVALTGVLFVAALAELLFRRSAVALASVSSLGVSAVLARAVGRVSAGRTLGLLTAAAVEAAVPQNLGSSLGALRDVPLGALCGALFPRPGAWLVPLVAVLLHKGLSVGFALAAIVPTLLPSELKETPARSFARRLAAGVIGVVVGRFLPANAVPAIHSLVFHQHLVVEWGCAILLAGLFLQALLRLGPRDWLALSWDPTQPARPHHHEPHEHSH